jgi:hypothetical protein
VGSGDGVRHIAFDITHQNALSQDQATIYRSDTGSIVEQAGTFTNLDLSGIGGPGATTAAGDDGYWLSLDLANAATPYLDHRIFSSGATLDQIFGVADNVVIGVTDGSITIGPSTQNGPGVFVARIAAGMAPINDEFLVWMPVTPDVATAIPDRVYMAVDGAGNIALAGVLGSGTTIDFGTGPISNTGAFFAKYGPTGTYLWHALAVPQASSTSTLSALDVEHTTGDLLFGGAVLGSVTFAGQLVTGPAFPDTNPVVGRLAAANGAALWVTQGQGTNTSSLQELVWGVRGEDDGNVIASGGFFGVHQLDWGGAQPLQGTSSNVNGFVVRLDGSTGGDSFDTVLPDVYPSGNPALELTSGDFRVASAYYAPVTFGPCSLPAPVGNNLAHLSYAQSGAEQWAAEIALMGGANTYLFLADSDAPANGNLVGLLIANQSQSRDFGLGPKTGRCHVFELTP